MNSRVICIIYIKESAKYELYHVIISLGVFFLLSTSNLPLMTPLQTSILVLLNSCHVFCCF